MSADGSLAASPRVLIVGDNLAIRDALRKALHTSADKRSAVEMSGSVPFGGNAGFDLAPPFEIDSAAQKPQALAMVRQAREEQRPYALAFIDMGNTQGGDGIDAIVQLWGQDRDIQVVVCTAYADRSWSQRLAEMGRSDRLLILKKPFHPIEVIQIACALTEKWRLAQRSRSMLTELELRVDQRTRELMLAGEKLKSSEAQYRLLFDYNPNPTWVYDLETLRFLRVNDAAVEHYGYSAPQFQCMTIRDLQPVEDIAGAEEKSDGPRRPARSGGSSRHRRRDGSLIEVELLSERIVFDGRPAGLVLAHNVTGLKRAEHAVQRLNRVYAVLSQINGLTVRVSDRDQLFKAACRIAVEQGGFRMSVIATVERGSMTLVPAASASESEVLLGAVDRLVSSSEDGLAKLADQAISEKRTVVCNDWRPGRGLLGGDEQAEVGVRAVALLPLIVANESVGVLLLCAGEAGIFQDDELKLLTELADDVSFAIDYLGKAERLHYLAFYDGLTGLANRSLFLERAAQFIQNAADTGQQLALYLFDLERFKHVNDSLGRLAGDALLKQVAVWLTRRSGNASLVARVGADQFAVLLPLVAGEDAAVDAIEKEVDAFVQQPFRLQDAMFRIAAKAGIALFPDNGGDAETLIRNAEAALKQAKSGGDRCLPYRKQMTETVAGRLTLETRLSQALRKGEFVLHYQAKSNLQTGKLTGAEALIRWQDPQSGLVPPAKFIPILEETGLIHDVGRWALRQAVADYLRWRSAGLPAVRIAVNVSPLQLRHSGFISEIWQAIAADPRSPGGLELEITESLIMEGIQQNIASLQAIREMGVNIAIDDFGTGFSSLSYLSRLPVDTLKIDRSFVVDMTAGPQGLSLVSTIINLAHSLKLKVVAEGVETTEQSRLLRLLNCDEIQGYLYSKAVPGDMFEGRFLRGPAASDEFPAVRND